MESASSGPGTHSGGEGSHADPAAEVNLGDALLPRATADGSPSLWSARFGEAFHSGEGALSEARLKFVAPAQLERFAPGSLLRVVDVGVGLGYNSAALIEAAQRRRLRLQWWGLEEDPRPIALALADARFRGLWQPGTLALLEQLQERGEWRLEALGEGRWLLGDARRWLQELLAEMGGRCDLVLHDAFSPGRCPQLWSLEFLSGLAKLLRPEGRLLTYCSAAAVRQGLRLAGLQLASLQQSDSTPERRVNGSGPGATEPEGEKDMACRQLPSGAPNLAAADGPTCRAPQRWSLGTAASPIGLQYGGPLRPLGPMEWEHLATRAAEPYRDPSGTADTGAILAARRLAQAGSGACSTGAWRRRWAGALGSRRGGSAQGAPAGPPPTSAAAPG